MSAPAIVGGSYAALVLAAGLWPRKRRPGRHRQPRYRRSDRTRLDWRDREWTEELQRINAEGKAES